MNIRIYSKNTTSLATPQDLIRAGKRLSVQNSENVILSDQRERRISFATRTALEHEILRRLAPQNAMVVTNLQIGSRQFEITVGAGVQERGI